MAEIPKPKIDMDAFKRPSLNYKMVPGAPWGRDESMFPPFGGSPFADVDETSIPRLVYLKTISAKYRNVLGQTNITYGFRNPDKPHFAEDETTQEIPHADDPDRSFSERSFAPNDIVNIKMWKCVSTADVDNDLITAFAVTVRDDNLTTYTFGAPGATDKDETDSFPLNANAFVGFAGRHGGNIDQLMPLYVALDLPSGMT